MNETGWGCATGELWASWLNGSGSLVMARNYDGLGRPLGTFRSNGVTTGRGYDGPWLTAMFNSFPNAANDVGTSYAYNPAGQIVGRTLGNDLYAWRANYDVSRSYDVDGFNRVTRSGSYAVKHDGRGNVTQLGAPVPPRAG